MKRENGTWVRGCVRLLVILVVGALPVSCSTARKVAPAAKTGDGAVPGDARDVDSTEKLSHEKIKLRLGRLHEKIRDCLEKGDYHGAMRLLPAERRAWQKLMAKTGKSYEGAHGYLSGSTLFGAAERGDADWGKILDDPEIPYADKTSLVFQILETRLGKGAVYVGDDRDSFIVPCGGPIDLDRLERSAGI